MSAFLAYAVDVADDTMDLGTRGGLLRGRLRQRLQAWR